MTPFTAVFQYRRFFASPEGGGIGGGGEVTVRQLKGEGEGVTFLACLRQGRYAVEGVSFVIIIVSTRTFITARSLFAISTVQNIKQKYNMYKVY